MPEGDAVLRAAQRLHSGLVGQRLLVGQLRWPSLGDVDLAGRSTVEVLSRGKHLLHRFDDGRTLHTHLRMEGRWRVRPIAEITPAQRHSPDLRVLLATEQTAALGRKLGLVELLDTADEERVVGHLGPDLLGPGWDEDEALRRLRSHPEHTIAEALLDQRNLAGLGTIYTSEPLFLSRQHPWHQVASLSDQTLRDIVRTALQSLKIGVRWGDPVLTGDPRNPTYVFGRRGLPCRRCAGTVRMATVGQPPRQRVLAYCPRCQGGLAAHDDGSAQRPLGAGGSGRRNDRPRRSGYR